MSDWKKIELILDKILEVPVNERLSIVKRECGSDRELREKVEKLLSSISESESWLRDKDELFEEIASEFKQLSQRDESIKPGRQIGAYTIKELLGEGGMGAVYLAVRSDGAFEQKVAIKVIREGMYSQRNIERFETERNILAKLNHSGIARLYHGGMTLGHNPYFVMEYVNGLPIDQYCDINKLSVEERILLFEKVLKVIQYAHENLVIHRDLKPDNILVTDDGEIKILDYGIAKMLVKDENDTLDLTKTLTATPRYSAPEQISERKVTTASDVYSLGVILYKLIVGDYPIDFDNKSFFEVQQAILFEEPVTPYSRFVEYGSEKKKELALTRSTSAAQLKKLLRSDLGSVVLKALEKKVENRYRTAESFHKDLSDYREGLPVTAQTQSIKYKAYKFANRNRSRILALSAVLVGFIALSLFYVTHLNKEKSAAQSEAEKATQIKELMIDIFSSNDPRSVSFAGIDLTVSRALTAGIDKVERELFDQPETYIELMSTIGRTLENIEDLENAHIAYTKALEKSVFLFGEQSTEYSARLSILASLLSKTDSLSRAKELMEKSIEIEEHLPEKSFFTLAHRYGRYGLILGRLTLFEEARLNLEKADSLYQLSNFPESEARYNSLSNLADVYIQLRNNVEAEKSLLKVRDYYENYYDSIHVNIATNLGKLGNLYYRMSENRKAEKYLLEALEMRKSVYGDNSSYTAHTHALLSLNYRVLDEMENALFHTQRDLEITKTISGEESLNFSNGLNNLAIIQKSLGDYENAEISIRQSIDIKEQFLNPLSPSLGVSYYNLADILHITGELNEARDLFQKVLEIDKEVYGETHAEIAIDLTMLGVVERDLGELDSAYETFIEAEKIFNDKYPQTHHRVGRFHLELGKLYQLNNQPFEALSHFESALEIFLENFDESHTSVIDTRELIAKVTI